MRYFFISFSHYKHIDDATVFGDGSLTLITEGTFPNQTSLLKDIQEKYDVENITILNIQELSEADYKDFVDANN